MTDGTWERLGAALALNMLRQSRKPGLLRVLLEKRGWWRFKAGANKARPLTKRRTKLLVQVIKLNQLRRDQRHRAELEEDLKRAGFY